MTDPPIYEHLNGLEAVNRTRWQWNPRRWVWQTYTSPSGRFRVVWRGPMIRSFYRD